MGKKKQLTVQVLEVTMVSVLFSLVADGLRQNGQKLIEIPAVTLEVQSAYVTMRNAFANVTLTNPGGQVTSISYGGVNNLLDTKNVETNRGYWTSVWNITGPLGVEEVPFVGTSFEVARNNGNMTELSFKTIWNTSQTDKPPLNFDKRFVMLRNSPGFYTYAVVEHLAKFPPAIIQQINVAFKLHKDMFQYMAISDERQRVMPTQRDQETGKVLEYKEAVLLTNPTNPNFKGEVDDKYFYANDLKDDGVHGWVSTNPPIGFWMISPSNEFRTGGPYKQDLTAHVGPTVLSVFVSNHYAGEDLAINFKKGEYWKKVIGPVFVYLNSDASAKDNPSVLWNDAKKRMNQEVASWPYNFPLSKDYIKPNQRGSVRGQLLVNDWFISKKHVPAANAYIGLGPPGDVGSWQRENKGYQFWTKADSYGKFTIEGVIPGTYNLYATIPGILGDYKYPSAVKVNPGSNNALWSLVYKPPRNGATLWEIGVPDRTAAEFFIPNPPPQYKVHKYQNNSESRFKQYGLWEQYGVLYPKNDLVYNVATSKYSKDWFFAHVTRNVGTNKYEATTWSIIFNIGNVDKTSNYTLQLALAAANGATLHVRVNDAGNTKYPLFSTGHIGWDNAIARHGIHGLYWFYSIKIAGNLFVKGKNTIYLRQTLAFTQFNGVMYDYLRLEGPH